MKRISALLIVLYVIINIACADEIFATLSDLKVSYEQDIASADSMLFLWTSRCPYCIRELREMNKNENVCKHSKCFFVNLGEDAAVVSRVVKSLKLKSWISQNIVLDKSGYLAEKFSIIGVPTFIFMRAGKILDQSYYFDEDALRQIFKK